MRIAFVSPSDANDKTTWSGITYYIYKHLKEVCPDVVLVSPIKADNLYLKKFFSWITSMISKIRRKQCLNIYYSYFLAKSQSRYIDKFLKHRKIDFIISTTSDPFVFLKSKLPLILITDATVKLLYEEYNGGKGWSKLYHRTLEKSAKKVSQQSTLIVSSSKATSDSLIHYYKIPASKIVTIPFGANFDDRATHKVNRIIEKSDRINFLFVGVDWERKGGTIAVSICDELLIRKQVSVHLTIVGCDVPEKYKRPYLKNYANLNKNSKDDFSLLTRLYEESHFFMVFSKAEMYGIVFCEAAAYGLPVVTYSIGGIPDIVVDNLTGIMLPRGTKNEIFVERILSLISDPDAYVKMSEEARSRYETLLNWDAFTKTLLNNLEKLQNSGI